jgi:hypothetical protein
LVLRQAEEDKATALIFEVPSKAGADAPLRYKVEGSWYDWAPFPSRLRQRIMDELRQMAGVAKAKFPLDGTLSGGFSNGSPVWRLRIASPDAEYVLAFWRGKRYDA